MTLRERLEAIKARHTDVTVKCRPNWGPNAYCEWCSELHPCPDYIDAVDGLGDLDDSVIGYENTNAPHGYQTVRFVRDPSAGGGA